MRIYLSLQLLPFSRSILVGTAMQKKPLIAMALALASLTACAKRPDAIVPVDIPMAAYTGDSCERLAQELIGERSNLAALSKQQNNAATGDAMGVFLIGVPASSLTGGDKEGVISVSKGKVVAIESAIKTKGCR